MKKQSEMENKEGREMSLLYGQGWKKGFTAGFKSGIVTAVGVAVVLALNVGFSMLKNKGKKWQNY